MDELLDMPSDVERAARVKVDTGDSTHVTKYPTTYTDFLFLLIPFQDLLVDCFKPTEVSCPCHPSSSTFPLSSSLKPALSVPLSP